MKKEKFKRVRVLCREDSLRDVLAVLLSGNFAEIEKWQDEQAYERTRRLRPDLLDE